MKIENRQVGGRELFFSVEEGMANWGDISKALKMVDHAKKTGADGIEFQLLRADDFIVGSSPKHGVLKQAELADQEIKRLITYVRGQGLAFIATVLSPSLIEKVVAYGCSAFNINGSDVNNPHIIDGVAKSRRPIFLSVPLATEKEIDWAMGRIRQKSPATPQVAILHGQHTMFTAEGGPGVEETTLGFIPVLKKRYNVPVGFIDHTSLPWMPAVAVAAGADIVTKHLAISRKQKGPDWHICLEPKEMTEAICYARKARTSVCQGIKKLSQHEQKDVLIMRKSIVTARPVQAGEAIKKTDIQFKRPGHGIPPDKMGAVVGRRPKRDLSADQLISYEDLR
jgi:N,N'-diacetyllegionaminate synthase